MIFIKKERNLKIIVFFLCIFFLSACGGSDSDEVIPEIKVNFSFNSPSNNAIFNLGDVIDFNVDISSENDLFGYEVIVYNKATSAQILSLSENAIGKNYNITTSWTNIVSDHSDMIMEVKVKKDAEGNTEKSQIGFHCHPF